MDSLGAVSRPLGQGAEKAIETAATSKKDKDLMNSCKEFESYFVTMMFKEMRKTINDSDGIIKKNNGEKMFTEMLDEETGKSVASGSNGLGLAQLLYKQMKTSANGITYEEYLAMKK